MRKTLLAVMCLLLSASSISAQPDLEPRTRWGILRVQGMITLPAGNDHAEIWNDCGNSWLSFLNFGASINVNTSGGMLGSFEYVIRRKYGFELGMLWWRQFLDLKFETEALTVEGTPNFIMPTLGFNYHFMPGRTADLYAGVLCCLGIMATGTGTDIDVSKDLALGINFGIDYYVSGKWSIGGSAKYLDFGELDFTFLPPGIDGIICDNGLFGLGRLNTLSLSCGVAYRF